jgi:hypothetical protein
VALLPELAVGQCCCDGLVQRLVWS